MKSQTALETETVTKLNVPADWEAALAPDPPDCAGWLSVSGIQRQFYPTLPYRTIFERVRTALKRKKLLSKTGMVRGHSTTVYKPVAGKGFKAVK